MKNYFSYEGDLYVPYHVAKVRFCVKEDRQLGPLQAFILEALDCGANVWQISEATLFARRMIEEEIDQLIAQSLLKRVNDEIVLTELSEHLLLTARSVEHIGQEQWKICVNMVTHELTSYTDVAEIPPNSLLLLPNMQLNALDGITLEENDGFFAELLGRAGIADAEIEAVIPFVYVELENIPQQLHKPVAVHQLPCVISDDRAYESPKASRKNKFLAHGKLYRIRFATQDPLSDLSPEETTALLNRIHQTPEDLCDADKRKAELHWEWEQGKWKDLQYCFDTASGRWCMGDELLTEEKLDKTINLELPALHRLMPEIEQAMMRDYRARLQIPEEIVAMKTTQSEEDYFVNFLYGDLAGTAEEAREVIE